MEFGGKLTLVILMQFISSIKLTSAHNCESGICQAWEYCCEDNICCRNNDKVFNIMIAACIFLVLLFFCCSIFFICRIGCPMIQMVINNYRNLPRDRNSSMTNLAAPCSDLEYDERIYSDPPPPYSEVVQMRK